MQHLADPLQRLFLAGGRFLENREQRFLYVPVDSDLFEGAVSLIRALEWHPENKRPFIVLDAPFSGTHEGWRDRTAMLRASYERIVEAFQADAISIAPLPAAIEEGEFRILFARTLVSVVDAFLPGTETETDGLIIVLAASFAEAAPTLARSLRAFVTSSALASVKWIWLHGLHDERPLATVEGEIGASVVTQPCRVDRDLQKTETDLLISRMRAAVRSDALTSPSGARPTVAPPLHPADPPNTGKSMVQTATPNRAVVDGILAATQALREERAEDALEPLRLARDECLALGCIKEAVDAELLFATIAAGAAPRKGRLDSNVAMLFRNAADRAIGAGFEEQAAVVLLMFGCTAMAQGDHQTAIGAFVESAERAREGETPTIRFHALNFAGDMAKDVGLNDRAIGLWSEALATAKALKPGAADTLKLLEPMQKIEATVALAEKKLVARTDSR